VRHSYKLL